MDKYLANVVRAATGSRFMVFELHLSTGNPIGPSDLEVFLTQSRSTLDFLIQFDDFAKVAVNLVKASWSEARRP